MRARSKKDLPWYIEEHLLGRREIQKNGCWNYTGSLDWNGYGQMMIRRQGYKTSHLAWMLWRGKGPEKAHIHHTCQNPTFFNPDHLELKTPGDHMRFHKAAKRYCVRGHDLDNPENVYSNRRPGVRQCKLCARLRYHEGKQP